MKREEKTERRTKEGSALGRDVKAGTLSVTSMTTDSTFQTEKSKISIPSTQCFNPMSALQCMVNTLKPENAWGLSLDTRTLQAKWRIQMS